MAKFGLLANMAALGLEEGGKGYGAMWGFLEMQDGEYTILRDGMAVRRPSWFGLLLVHFWGRVALACCGIRVANVKRGWRLLWTFYRWPV